MDFSQISDEELLNMLSELSLKLEVNPSDSDSRELERFAKNEFNIRFRT